MNYIIRDAKLEDCKDIVDASILCWQQTYRGIFSDEYLDKLPETREESIKRRIENFETEKKHYVILEINNKIVGFLNCGASDYKEEYGEIFALYILKDFHKKGYGKLLIEAGFKKLKELNFDEVVIGCLEQNPTNNFYKHIGGKLIDTREFERDNKILLENIYYYKL